MTAHRLLARIALASAAPLLLVGLVATPAQAHGAPDNPVSRAVECGPEGGQLALSAACKAAIAVSGAQVFEQWDNLRVPNVRGRDRDVIPDGKLCSGGLAAYRGLDQPRADWPATKLTAGAVFTFRYRETIPHKGTFRMYLTKDGYDPTQPLTWSDLEPKPFLAVTDPPLTNDAYVMQGRLPSGKAGRHLIYTVWQNSSTPDTYYSCSDVVFPGGSNGAGSNGAGSNRTGPNGAGSNGGGSNGAGGSVVAPGGGSTGAAPAQPYATASAGALPEAGTASGAPVSQPATVAVSRASSQSPTLPFAIAGAAVLGMAGVAAAFLIRRRRASLDA
jgi:chitin-binding protein